MSSRWIKLNGVNRAPRNLLAYITLHGLDELAERLGNFHECARALIDCLHTRDITRQTDLSMIEAAKHM